MSELRPRPTSPTGREPARNDPCPCGSGLKYKQCCANRPDGLKPAAKAPAALGPLTQFGRELTTLAGASPIDRAEQPRDGAASRPGPTTGRRDPALARCLSEAKRLRETGRIAAAIPLLQQAAQLDPADARIWLDLGAALVRCGRATEATDSLATAIRLDPSIALAHHNLGLAFAQRGNVTEAMAAFNAAIERAPRLAEAHLLLGEIHDGRLQTAKAAEAFETAAGVLAGTAKGRLAAARAKMIRSRPEEAMTLLRRAIAIDPQSVDLHRLLAKTLVEAGNFDEAEHQFARTQAIDPKGGAPDYYELTRLRKMTPADRPLLERMRELLRVRGLSESDRMILHFGLGKAHDDLREFATAIGHFDAANRIRGRTAPLDRKALSWLVDRNIELFPDQAAFDASLGTDERRPVFILGMPRSGTTLVEQILSSHPAVAAGGELGFWAEQGWLVMAPDARPPTQELLAEIVQRYRTLLRGISPDALRVTDKAPFNFLFIGVLRLALPQACIIHCRRHPVDNCLSMYTTLLGARDTFFMGNREDLVFYHGEYSRLMRHWRATLPGRFLEVDYEALTADRDGETRRLVEFCELDWHDSCLQPEQNRRRIATASVWQARQPVYRSSVERWRNYQPWLGAFAELLPEAERG